MPRRDEYGRFLSDDNDDRSSRRSRFDEDDDREGRGRGSSRRGFAAMDPEERREMARRGGFASHGGRGSSRYEEGDDWRSSGTGSRGGWRDDEDDDDRFGSRSGSSRR